jgi:hypothetical protein
LKRRSFHSVSIKGKVKLGGNLKNKKHPKRPRKMRREYGPSYFAEKMSGLAAAARQLAKEEKTMASQPMTEKIQ